MGVRRYVEHDLLWGVTFAREQMPGDCAWCQSEHWKRFFLPQNHGHSRAAGIVIDDDRPSSILIYSRISDGLKIDFVITDSQFQRQQHAARLIEAMKMAVFNETILQKLVALVPEDNFACQNFLHRCGFLCDAILPGVSAPLYRMKWREGYEDLVETVTKRFR